jgi:hypothetical protein
MRYILIFICTIDTTATEDREVLVYLDIRQDENLLGSVFLKNESIETAIKEIKEVLT